MSSFFGKVLLLPQRDIPPGELAARLSATPMQEAFGRRQPQQQATGSQKVTIPRKKDSLSRLPDHLPGLADLVS